MSPIKKKKPGIPKGRRSPAAPAATTAPVAAELIPAAPPGLDQVPDLADDLAVELAGLLGEEAPDEPAAGAGGVGAPDALDATAAVEVPRPGDSGLVVYDPLTAYLRKVRAYPPVTREQEQALARRYRDTGDTEAARQLILANLSLVVRIALMFRRAIANALDLIQEGNVGLIQAVEKFDPDVGVRFQTYAAWWVKAYILKYLLDNARLVRVGTTNARRKLIYNLQKEKSRLESLGVTTGPRLLAEHFGVSEQDVIDVQAALSARDAPLDAPLGQDGDSPSRGSMLPDTAESVDEQVARRELQSLLDEKIAAFEKGLNEKDRAILRRRLVAEDPETLQQIGDRMGITREAVRQAEERLLRRLKEHLRSELGEDVLLQFRRS